MDTRLNCDIVRDLLPSYVDGLTSGPTNEAVEAHLKDCAECSDALRRMKEADPTKQPATAEVDYLKKVRRRARRTAALCAVGAAVLVITLVCIRLFVIGNEARPAGVYYSTSVSDNTVYFSGNMADSSIGVARVLFTEVDGVVSVRLYTAPKTIFNRGSFSAQYQAVGAVTEIRFGGLVAWENGNEISRTAAQLYAAKNSYVGDMSANSRIATILGISDQFGNYTNQLHTAEEPYGWTLTLADTVVADEEAAAQGIMMADSYVMLAEINNLGYVTWAYQTESGPQNYTVTAENASAFAGKDIKLCAETASELQALMDRLRIKWSGVRETLQEDGIFHLSIANRSDADIFGFIIHYYIDGKLIGSRTDRNADSSAFARNDTIEFDFVPEDFPEGTGSNGLSKFSFDLAVVNRDGSEIPVCQGFDVSAKYAWTFYFSLTGNYESGFTIVEG